MEKYYFVKVDGVWQKPFSYYPVSKFNKSNKNVEIYEIDLDDLKKKDLVWKNY